MNGRRYRAVHSAKLAGIDLPETPIGPDDLADVVGIVTSNPAPCHGPAEGGAVELAPGTRIREIAGFPDWFRVGVLLAPDQQSAIEPGEVRVYEQLSDDNNGATPDEIVDLSHVRVILALDTGGHRKTFADPANVARFVSLIRAGTVRGHMPDNGPSPTVDLWLGLDRGPPIVLHYWPTRHAVDRITVGKEFPELLGIGANFGAPS